jgi:DNA-binding FadR family transcriptional regulator
VREALRLLASQNLIVTTRGVAGGSFVVHPSPDQLIETLTTGVNLLRTSQLVSAEDILEARLFIELPVAELVAERRSEQDLQALRESLFDPYSADFELMAAGHSDFHEAMADACGNPLLTMIAKPLHRIANAREVLVDRFGRDFWIRVDADHRDILAAVNGREPQEARAATERHINHLRHAFEPPAESDQSELGSDEGSRSGPRQETASDRDADGGTGADDLAVSVAGGA